MAPRIRVQLSYANVMSTIAVFIVLGGGAYAATTLPKNSVGTKQIKNGAVTKAKLAKSVKTTGPTGPAGAQGPAGTKGDKGDQGALGTPGTNGTNGTNGVDGQDGARGPSDVFVFSGGAVSGLDNNSPGTNVVGAQIVSGDNLMIGKTVLSNTGAIATVNCILFQSGGLGTPLDSAQVEVPQNGTQTVTLTGGISTGSNFVFFNCFDNNEGTVTATDNKLTVLKVDKLH
jgi:Collagen triple helix repeat (20 copies)